MRAVRPKVGFSTSQSIKQNSHLYLFDLLPALLRLSSSFPLSSPFPLLKIAHARACQAQLTPGGKVWLTSSVHGRKFSLKRILSTPACNRNFGITYREIAEVPIVPKSERTHKSDSFHAHGLSCWKQEEIPTGDSIIPDNTYKGSEQRV